MVIRHICLEILVNFDVNNTVQFAGDFPTDFVLFLTTQILNSNPGFLTSSVFCYKIKMLGVGNGGFWAQLRGCCVFIIISL